MKKKIGYLLLMFFCLFGFGVSGFSNLIVFAKTSIKPTITAKSAVLVDKDSNVVIFEKNADERLPIASMTKLVSLAVVFDAIDAGILKENDEIIVSKTAADVGGSSAFLDAGSAYRLSDLLKTIIVSSANDSTVAVAEYLCGSENIFVEKMNKFAENLGLFNTNFENCTGLPAKEHYSTANDMVKIYKTVCDNELYLKFSKIWLDELVHPSGRKTELVNTNRLIKTYEGIESGKTGYTNSAGFCLTASAKRNDTTLIAVVIGADESKTRFSETSNLFDFGFENFKSQKLIDSKIPVTIFKPQNSKNVVEVYPAFDVSKLISKSEDLNFSVDYQLYELKAPIAAGETVGKIFVFDSNNMVTDEVELISKNDVGEIDFSYSFRKILNVW